MRLPELIELTVNTCRAECFWAVSIAFEYLLLPSEFFYDLGTTILFYVFYRLLHGLTENILGKEKGHPKTKVFHWGLVGIVAVAGVIEWVLYVMAVYVKSGFYSWSMVWKITDTATMILRWFMSWEILAWSIVMAIKSVKTQADVLVRDIGRHTLCFWISLVSLGPLAIIRGRIRFFLPQLVYLVLFRYHFLYRLTVFHLKHRRKCHPYRPSHHECVLFLVTIHMLP